MDRAKYTLAQLTAAIRACEEMEAGRELDEYIAVTIAGWQKANYMAAPDCDDEVVICPPDQVIRNGRVNSRPVRVPAYTSSPFDLAAAMGLVPEKFRVIIHHYGDISSVDVEHIKHGEFLYGDSATSTLSHALTLAALRAQLALCTLET